MARKTFNRIRVVNNSERPHRDRHEALRLVKRCLAVWVVENASIRELSAQEANRLRDAKRDQLRTARLCHEFRGPLPPAEVENAKFLFPRTDEQMKSNLVCLLIARRLCESTPQR